MKPRLFHGSPYPLTAIEPRWRCTNDGIWGNFVFAQPREIVAHAYPLKNEACFSSGVIGDWVFNIVTRETEQKWETELHKTEKGLGGFIYEVDASPFRPVAGGEWVAGQAIIISPAKTRFVTIEDCMQAGVQIFIIENAEKYSRTLPQWKENPHLLIMQGLKDGGLIWLNKDHGINPFAPPPYHDNQSHKSLPDLHL